MNSTNTIPKSTTPISPITTPPRVDQQRQNTTPTDQCQGLSTYQIQHNQKIFPQTPIYSPFYSGYQSMGSSFLPHHHYLEPLLDYDKELPPLKCDCSAFNFMIGRQQ